MTKQQRYAHRFSVAFHAVLVVGNTLCAAVLDAPVFGLLAGWSIFWGAHSLAKLREGVRA